MKIPRLSGSHGKHLYPDLWQVQKSFQEVLRVFWRCKGKTKDTIESWKWRTMGPLLRTTAHMKLSWHSTVAICHRQQSCIDKPTPKPLLLRWFLFKSYGLDVEVQDWCWSCWILVLLWSVLPLCFFSSLWNGNDYSGPLHCRNRWFFLVTIKKLM